MAINWKDENYSNLKKAVNNYNAKLKRLEFNPEISPFLPNKISYSKLSESIDTKKELEDELRKLRNFTKRGSENFTYEGENKLLKYQYHENKVLEKRVLKVIDKEIELQEYIDIEGNSRSTMSSVERDALNRRKEQIKNRANLGQVDFNNMVTLLKNMGNINYERKKENRYRERYLQKVEEHYSEMPHYEQFIERLNSFKSAKSFYDYIKYDDFASDLKFIWYYKQDYVRIYEIITLMGSRNKR